MIYSKHIISICSFWILSPILVQAQIKVIDPISVGKGIPAWNTRIVREVTQTPSESFMGYTECAETTEIKDAFLCASYDQKNMNLALLRASFFAEGISNIPKNTVVEHSQEELQEMLRQAGGHDLASKDLIAFYDAATEMCQTDAAYCLNDQETDIFENFVLPLYEKRKNFVLITYAVKSVMSYTQVITHEIMHAYYILQSQYRKTVDDFWEHTLSDDDRQNIRNGFFGIYDTNNEFLMKNEFQAYLLQAHPEAGHLAPEYIEKYRRKLMAKINRLGIHPVQVD
jgi:hypothetical protein